VPQADARSAGALQVGYKSMMYMVLHAEAVVDLVEKPFREIQFRQVKGDFRVLQGKWILEAEPEVRHAAERQAEHRQEGRQAGL
jgi:Polyketide cyclase / dehydrase and lipid transport